MSSDALKGVAEYITEMADRLQEFARTPQFYVIISLIALAIVALVLYRIYIALRNKRLGRIEYSRSFSEVGVYEGDEVEMIETVRNTGAFPLLWVETGRTSMISLLLMISDSSAMGTAQFCSELKYMFDILIQFIYLCIITNLILI